MIEIIVDNKWTLQLPEDISLQFIEENPLLVNDRIPSLYTLSFEVPPTALNLKALGFPNRVTSSSVKSKVQAEIRHTGLVMARGELLLLECANLLKLQFKGSRESSDIRKEMHKLSLGGYNYGKFPYDPQLLDYQSELLERYTETMLVIAHTAFPYAIAPVQLQGVEWYGREDRNGFVNAFQQYLNYYNPVSSNFYFNDDSAGTNNAKCRIPIFPFPYVKDIINNAFGEYLERNPFEYHPDLANLVTISMNHKFNTMETLHDLYTVPGPAGRKYPVVFPLVDSYEEIDGLVPLEWKMKSFMQHYLFTDFLKDLMKIFCMSTFPGVKFRIEFNNDIMGNQMRVNWDDKLAGDPIISYEAGKEYVFKYSGVDSSNNEIVNNKYPNVKAIYDAAYSNTDADGSVIYEDESTGAQYSITRTLRGLDSYVFLNSDIKNNPLSSKETESEKDKLEITSKVRPANMNILDFWYMNDGTPDMIPRKFWFVPQINNAGFDSAPYIMFWGGFANTLENNGEAYPLLMAHHTDHYGNRRLNTSLHPDGSDGLIEKFHGRMKTWVEKDKMRVKGSFRLTLLDIKKLEIWIKIYLHGRLFYIEKMDYSLFNHGISLVDVDLIEC